MAQREVIEFLQRHRGEVFTVKEIKNHISNCSERVCFRACQRIVTLYGFQAIIKIETMEKSNRKYMRTFYGAI